MRLNALKIGELQKLDVPILGKVDVTFKDVSIFQSTDKAVAIGLTIEARLANNIFTTKETVWLVSKFRVDNERSTISPTDLSIYSKTNNVPVDVLASVIEFSPVIDALRKALTYDFSAEKAKLLEAADQALNRELSPNLRLKGHLDRLRIDSVVANDTSLTAIINANGQLAVRSGAKPPAKL